MPFAPQLANTTTAQFRSSGVQATCQRAMAAGAMASVQDDDRRGCWCRPDRYSARSTARWTRPIIFVSAGRQLILVAPSAFRATSTISTMARLGVRRPVGRISAAYSRRLLARPTGTGGGNSTLDRQMVNSQLIGSALVGLRYNLIQHNGIIAMYDQFTWLHRIACSS